MRPRLLPFFGALLLLAACGGDPVQPSSQPPVEEVNLVPEYAISPTIPMDAAGIGASLLPDKIKLSAEQKAAIARLHQEFMSVNAADLAALRAIELHVRAAIRAHKSRREVLAILATAAPILQRLDAAFAKLQAHIWAVYTPEQQAWIEANRPRVCGPEGPPVLTDAQRAEIRRLRESFIAAIKPDLDFIRATVDEARLARLAGKSPAEVMAILAQAVPAQQRVVAAERNLAKAIDDLLTPEQRAKMCVPRPRG